MKVYYSSETGPLLLSYSDGTSVICDTTPTMYVNVPSELIMKVMGKYFGLRSDNARLPSTIVTETATAAREVKTNESEEDE